MRFTFKVILLFIACNAAEGHTQDYAAWKKVNLDGKWTLAAEKAVIATNLVKLSPKDILTFCPAYFGLDADKRVHFWVGLLSAMAKPESGFKPETKYSEPDIVDAKNQNVVSRGLLQVSMESANQKVYSCNIKSAEDLHKVDINLNCSARIMQYWVEKDSLIAAASKPAVGASRYWSVLRAWRGHLVEISAFTKGMEVCKP
jgi:hypothetical protein